MAIKALPPSTARLLGSSVAITTPQDLVKELVDNAIDAKATTIEIAISSNTVDKIQVRDNGSGIPVEDLDCLGRRAHTSKLRSFEELGFKAGQTLGFRGEALASANSLAAISLTTRTAGDPVASRVQLKFGAGGIEGRRPVSAPVGTSVQVTQLFETLPVRKQNALKHSQRSIAKVKELVQAYVLARPQLRVSFKVLEHAVRSLSYIPGPRFNTKTAVLQVIGRDVAAECLDASLTVQADEATLAHATDSRRQLIIVKGLLPKSDCETALVNGKGAFISIDARPVSSSQGLPKKLAGILKSHLQDARNAQSRPETFTKPFFQLSIRCPPDSYDVNIAPLKDEVLFTDEKAILNAFEDLCLKVYHGQNTKDVSVTHGRQDQISQHTPDDHDDFLLDDLELIEALEKGDTASSTDNDAKHRAAEAPRVSSEQDGYSRPADRLAMAKIRTVAQVNLARKQSDATDEICNSNLVEVHLPRQPLCSIDIPKHSQTVRRISHKRSQHGLGNIEAYFRPQNTQAPFDIATDNTATSVASRHVESTTATQARTGRSPERQPLRPLTEAELNRVSRESNWSPPQDRTETQSSRAGSISREALEHSPKRADPGFGAASLNYRGPIRGEQFSLASSLIQRGVGHVEDLAQRSPRNGPRLSIRTPPPSDPRRRQRPANSLFGALGLTSGHEEAYSMQQDGGEDQQQLETDVSRQHGMTNTLGRNGNAAQRVTRAALQTNPASRSGLGFQDSHGDYSPRSSIGDVRGQQSRGGNPWSIAQGQPTMPLPRGLQSQEPDLAGGSLGEALPNQGYLHRLQTLLMKTPPPSNSRIAAGEMELGLAKPSPLGPTSAGASAISTKLCHSDYSLDKERRPGPRDAASRRGSTAGLKRQASKRQPLEAIPYGQGTHDVAVTLSLELPLLKHWMRQWDEVEDKTTPSPSLRSFPMANIKSVRRQLRAVTASWLATKGSGLEVHYTMETLA